MNRHVHTIFCDDIRNEVGGKTSLIGIYGSQMFVSEIPCMIPKICLHLKAVTSANDPFTSIRVAVFQDDIIIGESAISRELLAAPPPAPKSEDGIVIQTLGFNFIFSPFYVERACSIRVRVYDEGREEMRGQALLIDLAPEGMI